LHPLQQQQNTNKIYIAPGILKRIGAQMRCLSHCCNDTFTDVQFTSL